MGDALSFWDILFLKDEIDLETYVIIEWVIPCVLFGLMILGIIIHTYSWEIKHFFRRLFRRKK